MVPMVATPTAAIGQEMCRKTKILDFVEYHYIFWKYPDGPMVEFDGGY